MSFQPIISITNVTRDAESFVFTDITGTSPTNPTGYGATNAPANQAAITSLYAEVQLIGGEPIHATSVTGTPATSMTALVAVADGVQWLRAFFGQLVTISFNVSSDRKTLTVTTSGPSAGLLTGIAAIAIAADDYPVRVISSVSPTIVLEEALPGTESSYTTATRYWIAEVRTLVLNCAESMIGNAIAKLPITRKDCGPGSKSMDILDKILLKLGAEYAFNCGNYSEAHEAAQMICGTTSLSNCNCGG